MNKNADRYTIDECRNIIYNTCIECLRERIYGTSDEEIKLIWKDWRRLVFVFDEKKAHLDHIDFDPPIQHDPSYYKDY